MSVATKSPVDLSAQGYAFILGTALGTPIALALLIIICVSVKNRYQSRKILLDAKNQNVLKVSSLSSSSHAV